MSVSTNAVYFNLDSIDSSSFFSFKNKKKVKSKLNRELKLIHMVETGINRIKSNKRNTVSMLENVF